MNLNKRKYVVNSVSVILLSSLFLGCGGNSIKTTATDTTQTPTTGTTPTTNPNVNNLGISDIPDKLIKIYTTALKFDRYTKIDTPNGGSIHIIAQTEIMDNQIVRARGILQHYLTNLPGSLYGKDKSEVANKMADNGAILLLLNGVDDGTNAGAELGGQPLYYGEMQVEGHRWYINQNYEHRDASFEEILHLVHDYGIGVDQNSEFNGALPNFQAEIRAAQVNGLSNKLWAWPQDQARWIAELTAENSLSQEYLASVIDTYYGLWGAFNSQYGMWGMYIAKTRSDLAVKDPQAATLMDNQFFHSYLTYNARIDGSFEGDFSLKFNTSLSYTHHSQYLKDITLTGSKNSNVIVNSMDNDITGNSGENMIIFSGPSTHYDISNNDGVLIVQDLQDDRDATNTLRNIEKLKFTDSVINSSDF
ncbi:hypothetical protein CJF42_21185 [Pseudoalteromonas sp. NBT06-2]|uniref:hypothetical protein n=1 Tax=Pseudoalteromonas sp. NBT06-2 TaxID=2025950 RepID=UPI000BA60FB7|nr:hypothetical protein [Pseudoalteromonas sp. NBT06-2]PAJ72444.1 hypothetical protein CJF42_21185 [Pseudoalteromonas sp. NBT06-2]